MKENKKPTHKATYEEKKAIMSRYKERYPEKIKARGFAGKIKPKVKGNNLHHWSYNDEHFEDIIELSVRHHNKAHVYLVYDQERKMYRRYDTNELLDMREKHESFINYCIQNLPD